MGSKYLRIKHKGGELEPLVEVDLGSCYWAILASYTKEKALQTAVSNGLVYKKLFETAKIMGFEGSESDVKALCNKHCLFNHGKAGFGTSLLWQAFRATFPKTARFVWNIRKGHAFGPFVLYRLLTEGECAIVLDRLIPALNELGIPVLNLHDGVLVPESEKLRVKHIFRFIATRYLGFPARVSCK